MTNILLSRGIVGSPSMIKHFKPFINSSDEVLIVALSHFPKYIPDEKAYNQYVAHSPIIKALRVSIDPMEDTSTNLYEKGGEYYQKMIESFQPYGIDESQIKWIHYYKDNHESAIKKIKKADIIYFPGGAPDLMMMRINAFGIKEALEAHQGLFIGSSAGAMIQMASYHISPDVDYPSFSYEQGLELLKGFSIEVHYRRRKKQKAALRKINRAFHHPIYAIPDDGAIIITRESIKCINSAKKIYDNRGVVRSK